MIAIHYTKGSFSEKWIEYCEKNNLFYKLVDCFSSDLVNELKTSKYLLWHWNHNDYKAQLCARQIIYSVERMGVKVFPNSNTCWHFDDKIGQKYLLEAINVPLIKSYVFYDKISAQNWITTVSFPKVFKLRSGAGSTNVKLVKSSLQAQKITNKMFSTGERFNRFTPLYESYWVLKRDKKLKSLFGVIKGIYRTLIPNEKLRKLSTEKNYIYAQDFIPENKYDIRVIVIGDKAFGIKRYVRSGDFRASGSGILDYDPKQIPIECLKIAFDVSEKLESQCLGFDFVFSNEEALIVEVSFAFNRKGYLDCQGYWNKNLDWIENSFNPEFFMIENLLKEN
jgi:glutathione synthase/RimK-type ligase-like ATP-grasp enzyme